jgi:hypothetical protein
MTTRKGSSLLGTSRLNFCFHLCLGERRQCSYTIRRLKKLSYTATLHFFSEKGLQALGR